jgi:hypothetical protein
VNACVKRVKRVKKFKKVLKKCDKGRRKGECVAMRDPSLSIPTGQLLIPTKSIFFLAARMS